MLEMVLTVKSVGATEYLTLPHMPLTGIFVSLRESAARIVLYLRALIFHAIPKPIATTAVASNPFRMMTVQNDPGLSSR